MALTLVAQNAIGSGIPAHQTGDLILAVLTRDGNSLSSPPAGLGWVEGLRTLAASGVGIQVCYKIAASNGETGGSWSQEGTSNGYVVLRSDISGGQIGVGNFSSVGQATSATPSWPSFTLGDPHSSSRVVVHGGHGGTNATSTFDDNDLSGFTRLRGQGDTTDCMYVGISTGVVSSFAGVSKGNVGISDRWATVAFEVYDFDPSAVEELTNPTTSSITGTTATVGISTTNTVDTLYGVVTASESVPNSGQIIAGQDHLGGAATFADNIPTPAAGANTLSATDLSAGATYYTHWYQSGAAIVSSEAFETPTVPVLSALSVTAITQSQALLNVTSDTAGGDIYIVVTESADAPSADQIVAGNDELDAPAAFAVTIDTVEATNNTALATLLTADTAYYAYMVQRTWTDSAIESVSFSTLDVQAAAVVILRDIDTGALKNAVAYAVVHAFDPADRSVVLATATGLTTTAGGELTLTGLLADTVGDTVDLVGFTTDGSDRFHASATVTDLNA